MREHECDCRSRKELKQDTCRRYEAQWGGYDVRKADEHREENWYNQERTWMSKNGVNYVELPIERTDRRRQFPNEATQKKFLELMSQKSNLPVLIHGNSGRKRVSMLAAVWLIKSQNYTVEKAVDIVEKIRDDSLTEIEKQFIKSLAG